MKKFIDHIILIILIFYIADASALTDNKVVFSVVFVFITVLFFLTKNKLNSFILIIVLIWFIINMLSYFVNDGLNFSLVTLISLAMKTILPFFMVKIIGPSFFDKLTKYVFVLSIISLILYIIDFSNMGLFDSISDNLNLITKEEQTNRGGWYIFVYMHSAWAYMRGSFDFYRNCGFMWEPGGFAMILIPIITYRFSVNNFRFDKYILIFIISLITTFSTSGILALLIIVGAYIINIGKRMYLLFIVLVPLFIYIGVLTYNLEFVSGKIEDYNEGIDDTSEYTEGYKKVNRFAIMKYNLEQAVYWPFGNGVLDSKYILDKYESLYAGPNTFARILYKWGFFGLFALLYYFYRFYKNNGSSNLTALLFTLAFSMVLFSNPGDLRPLIYVFVYYSLLYKRDLIKIINIK